MEQHMLAIVNEARRTFDGPRLLHDLISTSREESTAIDFLLADGTRVSLTYISFRIASLLLTQRICRLLSKYGAKRHIIPIILPQSPELYIAWRAVLQAGACVCPVQSDVPPERLKFIVHDVSADIVLCLDEEVSRLRSILPTTTCITLSREELKDADHASWPEMGHDSIYIRPTDPAYVMYTSGSTGLPKGVVVSHLSITQSLLAHEQHIPPFKRFLQFASPTFDVSIFEIFFPFLRGETLVGSSRERMLADLPGTITTMRADAAELTPTVAGTLLCTRDAAPCLQTLLTIGEMLTKRVVEEFGGSPNRDSMLFAMYGPTEAAVHCTIAPRLPALSSVRNIGKPLDTVTTLILRESADPESREIALVGEAGELAIAGQLADCYLNRPDETTRSFIELPGYGQVYRTGDRARCLSDGTLEFVGRIIDGQVKLRGQRVELGEIEEIASKTDGVSMAVALVIDDQLVLFYESKSRTPATEVRLTCKLWLPPFMRPGEVVMLTRGFPRLPSGKVDKKALERAHEDQTSHSVSVAESWKSDIERMIAVHFEQALGPNISRDSDLWSCGLDSLRAITIATRLRDHFPTIKINDILECESVAELAAHLQAHSGSPVELAETQTMPIDAWPAVKSVATKHLLDRPESLSEITPCSSMQIALLTETSAKPDLNFNHIKLTISADVLETDLWNALCRLAECNEILRSGFLFTGLSSMPYVQVVWERLEKHSLSMLHPLQLATEDDSKRRLLILRIHHALYDGWSWELIMDDLNSILAKQSLPSRPSFRDFALWQRQDSRYDSVRNSHYWKHLLNDHVRTPLPCLTGSRDMKAAREAVTQTLSLPRSKLSSSCAGLRISQQTLLQACWAIILSTYTDSPDVLFGTVASGRHVPFEGVDQIVGPCLSTLPSRVVLSTLRTTRDLLLYLQHQWLKSLEHSNTSLHDILSTIGGTDGARLFDSLLIWQEGDERSPSQRQYVWTGEVEDILDYTAVLEIEPVLDHLITKLTVDTSNIPVVHAGLMLQQLDFLFSGMVQGTETNLLTIWNAGPEPIMSISNPRCTSLQDSGDLTDTIQVLSEEDPTRPALKFVQDFDPSTGRIVVQEFSYGSLYADACNVSANLTCDYAIRPDRLVAIIAQKSIGLYIAILGIIMSGAGHLFIDPSTPPNRVESILQQTDCAVVLADDWFDTMKIHVQPPVAKIESLLRARTQGGGQPLSPTLNHLGYAVFTSGTTGVPKGVLVTRRNILSNLLCLSEIYPCEPGTDSLLQACSPAFDVSVFEIFWTWHMGMTLCAAANDVLFRDIESLIDQLGVTHLSLTPSVAALVSPENVPKVKMLVTAGEPMNSRVFQEWSDHGLFQGYGPSETTNICNVRSNVARRDHQNIVGPAFPNTSVFICAKSATPQGPNQTYYPALSIDDFSILPKGAIGEVWIGGEQVGRGYTDETLTAQSFLQHPSYGRLYRSGDVGRLLSDDNLVILGRIDDQAKIRGQRIELREINVVLLQNSLVRDAFSLVDGKHGSSRLLSFCVLPELADPKTAQDMVWQLFNTLEAHLPSYMVPDTLILGTELPLTRQGKVNKEQLLERYRAQGSAGTLVFSRQQEKTSDWMDLDEKELEVAKALSETVGIAVDAVHRSSSFYALGLDSISTIRFSQLLLNHGFGRLDVSTILKNPSLKALMPLLKSEEEHRNQQPRDGRKSFDHFFDFAWLQSLSTRLRANGLKLYNILPCTDLQQSMLATSETADSRAYQNSLRFAVKGDPSRLKRAWTEAIARHELLRCIFVRCPNPVMPYAQVVLQEAGLQWHTSEMGLQMPDLDEIIPITPFRIATCGTNEGATELKVDIHHALYDAEAMSNLLREVEFMYRKQPLPPPHSFEKYITYMSNLEPTEVQNFWERTIKGVMPYRLENSMSGEMAAKNDDIDHASKTLEIKLDALESSAHSQEVSVLSLLQCALARLMFYALDRRDVCFGNVFSGRNLPIDGIGLTFGPVFNTLPVRAQVKKQTSNYQLLTALYELNLECLLLQPSSPRDIQRLHSPDGRPLFDVVLLLQQEQPALDNDIWELVEDKGDMSFPFILEINQSRPRNEVTATFHSEVAGAQVLKSFLNCFDDVLRHCILYPQALAMDFSCIHSSLPLGQSAPQPIPQDNSAHIWEPVGKWSNAWSDEEAMVRDMMLDLSPLKKQDISRQSSLFNMGLDSISAVQMAARLRKFGYTISSSDILDTPTIFEIATRCTDRSYNPRIETAGFDIAAFDFRCRPNLCKSERLDTSMIASIRPCTPTQSGILTQYLRSKRVLYSNNIRLRLVHGIDLARLRTSWETAMQRHEMLRTGFAECNVEGYSFVMVTYHPGAVRLPWEEGAVQKTGSERLSLPQWRLRLSLQRKISHVDLSMLHALYDAQSLDMILSEVGNHYHGGSLPQPIDISPTISSILAQSNSQEARLFWQEENHVIQPTKFPDLNIYRSRQWTATMLTRKASLPLSDLQNHAARLDCSLQTIFQAAWAKHLAAYTGQDRVTFGLILSGRNFDDSRNQAVFPCINTVPCSVEVGDSLTTMLGKISKLNLGLSRFQHTPVTSIKRWQKLDTDPFDTIIVLQRFESKQGNGTPWTTVEDRASAEYAVSLEILLDYQRDDMVFQLTYSEHVLPVEAAELLLNQLDCLISDIVNEERSSVSTEIRSIIPSKHELLPSSLRFLHEMVERTADVTPNAPALEFVTEFDDSKTTMDTWSYADLDTEGNRIAHLLIQHGAKTGDIILVCFGPSPQASFAILGVLKAGCAYVAVDPGAPVDRKKFILQDSGSRIVLTTKAKVADFPRTNDLKIFNVIDLTVIGQLPVERPILTATLDPRDTCYCLYTSGSTGQPKGCLISHQSVVQAMLSFERIFHGHWSSESRWLQFASFHFDVSVLEQYWSWYIGICLTSAPRDLLFEDIPGFIRKMKITHLDLTPSLARLLTPESVPSLCAGVFIVGGEQVSQDIIETWGSANCLYNFYGPSEVTIGCTVRARVTRNTKPTNIGQQWDNVGTYVLEPGSEEPLIRGGVGELCLAGVLVGKGYLNRSELTTKSFVFLKKHKTRVYRTGDLVRLLHDDSFEFLGRIDDQVKLRGQRLEIGEINQVIRGALSDIRGVATVVVKHPLQGKEQLAAFFSMLGAGRRDGICGIVSNTEARSVSAMVRRHCMDVLPGYMVPAAFLLVNTMPLTVNNKIDNRRLVQLYRDSLNTGNAEAVDVATGTKRTESFRRVAEILADWLGLDQDQIEPESGLFELGLDSVSANGLSRKLRTNGFPHSTAATVMRNAMVTDLVDCLTASDNTVSDLQDTVATSKKAIAAFENNHQVAVAATLRVHTDEIESVAPCSPLQEGMISKVVSAEAGDSTYFAQFHYNLRNNIDLERIRDAWRSAQGSTSILRTYFTATAEGFAQVVLKQPMQAAGVEREDVTWSQNSYMDWIKSARSFDRVIPWRLVISPNWGNTYMTLCIFHGLYDGLGLQLLLDKVAKAYNSGGKDIPNSNFYEILPYGPLRQERGAKDFWSSRLPSVTGLKLKSKHPVQSAHDRFRPPSRMRLSQASLSTLCTSLNITFSALFQAGWLLCLGQTYSVNPSIGLVVSGRNVQHDDAEAIGPLFNTVPCAIHGLPEHANLLDLAKACHRFNVDMLPFQHTPLRDIARWVGQIRSNNVFDSLFVFQKESREYKHDLWESTPTEAVPDYPLNLEVEQKIDGSFVLTLVAKREYLHVSDEEALLSGISDLLKRATTDEKIALPEAFKKHEPAAHAVHGTGTTTTLLSDADAGLKQAGLHAITIRNHIADLSGVDANKIGITRPSLFELGLDSIDMMKLTSRLRNEGLTIPVSQIMRMPTISGICEHLERSHDGAQDNQGNTLDSMNFDAQQSCYRELLSRQSIELHEEERILPVTPMQEGLLVDYEKYYHVMAFELNVDVDIQRLKQAWSRVIQKQPILRTKFVAIEDSASSYAFVQIVQPAARSTASASLGDLGDGPLIEAADRVRSLARKGGTDAPTTRVRFLDLDSKRFVLLGMPHAAYDAWSLDLLHQQVSTAYVEDPSKGDEAAAIPYEAHLAATLQNASSDDSKSFWQVTLQDVQPNIFHGAVTQPSNPDSQFICRQVKISLSAALAFCKYTGVSMQSLGLACWTLVLAHYTRTLDVCFGLVLSGRTTGGADALIFPTFNAVLFRSRFGELQTLEHFIRKVHEQAIRVSEYQHFPLREALKLAGGSRNQSELFNTLFTYQKTTDSRDAAAKKLYHEIELQDGLQNPPYAVNVEMTGRDSRLWWTIATQQGVLDKAGVEAVLTTIEHVLKALVEESHSALLVTRNGQTSICGLAPTPLHPRMNQSVTYNDQQSNATDDENWTDVESAIRHVLAEVSNSEVSSIKKTTGFYNLGLDSISAIKVAGLLKKRGLKIAASKIVEQQTLKNMAKITATISEPQVGKDEAHGYAFEDGANRYFDITNQHGIARKDVESLLPATSGQAYMLDAWAKSKGRLLYPCFWLVVEGVAKDEFDYAMATLAETVPLLRTTFINNVSVSIGGVLQVIFTRDASRRYPLPWSYVAEEDHGKLLVTLKLHHALYDAVSLHVIIAELERLCSGDQLRQQQQLCTDFRPFLTMTHGLDTSITVHQKEFWRSCLHNPSQGLARGSFEAPRIEHFCSRCSQVSKLHRLLRREGLSVQTLFFAICAKIYGGLIVGVGNTDAPEHVVIGIYLANRSLDIADLPSLAAPTFNIVPLKVNVSLEREVLQVAREIQNDIAQISRAENCGVSLREIYEWTGKRVDFVVNFLKLPGAEDDGTGGDTERKDDAGGVRVSHADAEIREEMKARMEMPEARSPFLKDSIPADSKVEWCAPTIDVEAKVVDGWLDVGVFAPEDMLDEQAVKRIVEEIREGLEGLGMAD